MVDKFGVEFTCNGIDHRIDKDIITCIETDGGERVYRKIASWIRDEIEEDDPIPPVFS